MFPGYLNGLDFSPWWWLQTRDSDLFSEFVFVLWSLLPLTEKAAAQLLLQIMSPKALIKLWEIILAEDLDTQQGFFIPQFKLNEWNS